MLPLVGIPATIEKCLKSYRQVFGKEAGFQHISRYISGLLMSSNKTACCGSYQTVVTGVVSNQQRVDGIAVEVQQPNSEKEELAYLEMTVKDNYEQMEQVKERILELLHYQKNRLAYRKRTEIAVELVRQLEAEGQFTDANYAFDQGVLSDPLTQVIEESGKHWVSEIERSRHILWNNQWQRVDSVASNLKTNYPESFRDYICSLSQW